MEKKCLNEFVSLFKYLSDAAGIIEESYNPIDVPPEHRDGYEKLIRLQRKKIEETYNRIIEIQSNTNRGFMADLTNEIETNLYKYKDSQEIYIKAIIRQFTDIVPYFDIPNIPEIWNLSFNWEKDSIKIGNKTYGRGMNYIFKTLVEESSKSARDKSTFEEHYIISSKDLLRIFYVFLDAKCLDFDIDIIHFQQELNIYLFKNRNTAHRAWLYDLGYREKLNQISSGLTDKISQNPKELEGKYEAKESPSKSNNIQEYESFFNSRETKVNLSAIFEKLKGDKYFDNDSDLDTWLCICGINTTQQNMDHLNWVKEQQLLAYLIDTLFGDTDSQRLWVITSKTFTVKGKSPNTNSMKNAISKIKKDWKSRPKSFDRLDKILKM